MAIQVPGFTTDQQYPFWHLRKMMGSSMGVGILNPGDYLVTLASGFQVNIASGTANVRQTVNSEGSSFYSGVYEVHNDASTNPVNTVSAPVSFPRVDQVILRVYDVAEQGLGGSSKAQIEWLQGAETSGATLDNRNGAPTLPDNSVLLADVLQTVGEGSISSSNIRDRRTIASPGVVTTTGPTFADYVMPQPVAPYPLSGSVSFGSTSTGYGAAIQVFLPRRMVVKNIQWAFGGGSGGAGTLPTSSYWWFISDASGYLIASTASQSFPGSTGFNTGKNPLQVTTTLEAGHYYVGFTANQLTASTSVVGAGWSPSTVFGSQSSPYFIGVYGIRTSQSIPSYLWDGGGLGYIDIAGIAGTNAACNVPAFMFSSV